MCCTVKSQTERRMEETNGNKAKVGNDETDWGM